MFNLFTCPSCHRDICPCTCQSTLPPTGKRGGFHKFDKCIRSDASPHRWQIQWTWQGSQSPWPWSSAEPASCPSCSPLKISHLKKSRRTFDTLSHTGCFFNWYPPKKLTCGKPRFNRWIYVGVDWPRYTFRVRTQPRLTFLYLELLGGVPVKKHSV